MDFSDYVKGSLDLSPSFSTSDNTTTSLSDSADSNFSSIRVKHQYPCGGLSQQICSMTSQYSGELHVFPARELQDCDMGPGFTESQPGPQVRLLPTYVFSLVWARISNFSISLDKLCGIA